MYPISLQGTESRFYPSREAGRFAMAGTRGAGTPAPGGGPASSGGGDWVNDDWVRGGWVPGIWRRAFGRGRPQDRRPGMTDPQLWVHQSLGLFAPGVLVAGLLAVIGYAVSAAEGWRAFGVGCAVIAGSAAIGGVLGFLFGIPLSPVAKDDDGADSRRYRSNTSLEQISDWLTKIIVGVGLVELQNWAPKLGDLVNSAAAGMGGTGAQPVVAGLMGVSWVAGFVIAYLVTRTTLPLMLTDAERQVADRAAKQVEQKLTEVAVRDAGVQELVTRALDGDDDVTESDLVEALRNASQAQRIRAFNAAFRQRQKYRNRRGSPEVRRTIPVFTALAAVDEAGKYFRNHGELGYAWMTLNEPLKAEAEFDLAIQQRPTSEQDKYFRYELYRAEARILNQRPTELVLADVLAVLATPKGLSAVKTTPTVRDWVIAHRDEVRAKAPAGVVLP